MRIPGAMGGMGVRFDDRVRNGRPPAGGLVLMSAGNAEGWKLEDLLVQLGAELAAKTARLNGDCRPAARRVADNNARIMGLLAAAGALQADSVRVLATVGPDMGPAGKPRIGLGSES